MFQLKTIPLIGLPGSLIDWGLAIGDLIKQPKGWINDISLAFRLVGLVEEEGGLL